MCRCWNYRAIYYFLNKMRRALEYQLSRVDTSFCSKGSIPEGIRSRSVLLELACALCLFAKESFPLELRFAAASNRVINGIYTMSFLQCIAKGRSAGLAWLATLL